MKNRNAGLGVFLISIGIIWVLVNLGIINFSIFDSLLVLWPLVLIVIGVAVIFRESTLIKVVAWLLFLAVIVFYGSTVGNKATLKNKSEENKRITIEKHEQTRFGELKLVLGGINCILSLMVYPVKRQQANLQKLPMSNRLLFSILKLRV
jgi:uncharacterized membrane protein YhaH (DUF805 family)